MDSGPRIVLIATLPDPKDMCCLEVSINPSEKHDSSAKSNFHWRILKCRQLIFSEQQIIASPVLGTENQMHIVMPWKFFRSEQFHKCLQNLKLLMKEPIPVTKFIYESCLRYTIIARMAPLWNQVENYLVHGRDFLTSNRSLEAVKMDISVNGKELFIILWPLRLQMGQVKLEDFDVPSRISQDSFCNSSISQKYMQSQVVHVLPSLKKGEIVHISHEIPLSCPYKTYKELRRHWKNMYGYRLPEIEGKMLYYSISFHPMNPTLYTYPHMCVRPHKVMLLRTLDQMKVLRTFHDDLLKKLPRVCGQILGINKNLAYAVPNIQANIQISGNSICENFPNLRFTNFLEMKNGIISQSIAHEELDISEENNKYKISYSQTTSVNSTNISYMTPNTEIAVTPAILVDPLSPRKQPQPKLADSPPVLFHFETSQKEQSMSKKQSASKYVPTFKKCGQYASSHDTHASLVLPQNLTLTGSKTTDTFIIAAADSNQEKSTYRKHVVTGRVEMRNSQTSSMYKGIQPSETPLHMKIVSCNENQNVIDGHEISLKRSGESSGRTELDLNVKKPRSRPQVQLEIDVEVLARKNDLARVNTATLVNWLRSKLVPCKVKDRKSELVDKVKTYLNIPC